jgi:hypothetical protein
MIAWFYDNIAPVLFGAAVVYFFAMAGWALYRRK